MRRRLITAALFLVVTGCGGGGGSSPIPAIYPIGGSSTRVVTELDGAAQPCSVSFDGKIWYSVQPGAMPPTLVTQTACNGAGSFASTQTPELPQWAHPSGATQTLLVLASLQQPSRSGVQAIATPAHADAEPVSWLVADPTAFSTETDLFQSYHQQFGDDVSVAPDATLIATAQQQLPWFQNAVSVEGAGHERQIAFDISAGVSGFWGIAWNSQGIDGTADEGAPWGVYCADPASYKRPAPDGSCNLVAVEWTARDLTRAYLTEHEEYYSTDPDDLQARAEFDANSGAAYLRALVDAYAAGGAAQPMVMVAQQESAGMDASISPAYLATDEAFLTATDDEAKKDGMRAVTIAEAVREAKTFAAAPRAIAFPYIPTPPILFPAFAIGANAPFPATLDYHDSAAGMTFVEGMTLPVRIFPYALATTSSFSTPLPMLLTSAIPALVGVSYANGQLTFQFSTPQAVHFGIALWSDPARVQWLNGATSGGGRVTLTQAGRAATVAAFDLPAGNTSLALSCSGCTGTTLPLSP